MNTFNRLSGQGDVLAHIEDSFRNEDFAMNELNVSLLSFYAVCRYSAYKGEREAMWKDLEACTGDSSTIDMICDWIMQCGYNG